MPIPNDAKKVFSGVIFDVYQWPVKMYDGSIVMYEKVKRLDSVGIIAVTQEKKIIVLVQRQPGITGEFIGLPSGRVERGENPFSAAKREFREETGYESREWNLWDCAQPLEKVDWASYTFIARNCQLSSQPMLDPGERINLKMVGYEEFIELVFKPYFRDIEVPQRLIKDGQISYMFNQEKLDKLKSYLFL